MPRLCRSRGVMPLRISETGAGSSVTMIDAATSARWKPGNSLARVKSAGGTRATFVPGMGVLPRTMRTGREARRRPAARSVRG